MTSTKLASTSIVASIMLTLVMSLACAGRSNVNRNAADMSITPGYSGDTPWSCQPVYDAHTHTTAAMPMAARRPVVPVNGTAASRDDGEGGPHP